MQDLNALFTDGFNTEIDEHERCEVGFVGF